MKLNKYFNKYFPVVLLSIIIFSFFLIKNIFSWTLPQCNPPNCDLNAPIDTSLVEQTKSGNLNLGNNLTVSGLLRVGLFSSHPTGTNGALYYNTSDHKFYGYQNGSWSELGGGGGFWIQSGNNIYNTNSGNVGIGTTSPTEKLEVSGNIKLSGASPTYRITNVASPVNDSDVATKGWVLTNSSSLPAGSIIMYSGPWYFDSSGLGIGPLTGWALCNGNNGTPNLTDRFVLGTNLSSGLLNTGGNSSISLNVSQLPSHSHTLSIGSAGTHTHSATCYSAGSHSHNYWVACYQAGVASGSSYTASVGSWCWSSSISSNGSHCHTISLNDSGDHTHSGSIGNTGSNSLINIMPPYLKLAFIMKL